VDYVTDLFAFVAIDVEDLIFKVLAEEVRYPVVFLYCLCHRPRDTAHTEGDGGDAIGMVVFLGVDVCCGLGCTEWSMVSAVKRARFAYGWALRKTKLSPVWYVIQPMRKVTVGMP